MQEIAEAMRLSNITDRPWHIQESNALSGQGVNEGLSWLTEIIKRKWAKKPAAKGGDKKVQITDKCFLMDWYVLIERNAQWMLFIRDRLDFAEY